MKFCEEKYLPQRSEHENFSKIQMKIDHCCEELVEDYVVFTNFSGVREGNPPSCPVGSFLLPCIIPDTDCLELSLR